MKLNVSIEIVLLLDELVVVVVGAAVVVDVYVLVVVAQIIPGEPSNIPSLFAVEVLHAPQSFR